MTTNSPNPVDGDVQALDGKELKIAAEYWTNKAHCIASAGPIYGPVLSQLAKVALAAMTAEPVAYTDAEELETLRKGTFADMFTPHESYKTDQLWIPLYTTPPAQILRPVELPNLLQPGADGYDDWYMHSSEDGEYMKADDVIAALENAGVPYEVKND